MARAWKKNEKIRRLNGSALISLFKYFNLRYAAKGAH